jgi:predicted esterase
VNTRLAVAIAGLAGVAVAGEASVARAQQTTEALAPAMAAGKVIPIVVSGTDTGERYALYLPQRYNPARKWPTLLVMDPRGRALVGMARFQEAAERDGYIVLSSYNTLSDSTEDPNTRAINAMLADLFAGLAADPKRVYLAGFSGTARMAWGYAYQLGDHVPGILAFAAGLPWRGINAYIALKRPSTFAWFGAAGAVDFNYEEVRALDRMVDSSTTIPHRVEYFNGAHGWPPARVCGDALDWMELQAMKTGLRSRDDSLLGAWVTARLLQARAAEDSGNTYEAYLRYRATRDDFRGLHDVPDAAAKVAALEKAPAVRQRRDREASLAAEFDAYTSDAMPAYMADLNNGKHPPTLNDALSDLKIRTLQQAVRDSTRDPLGAQSAGRTLALVMANTGFYWPRTYFAKNDPTRALAVLDIAHEVDPTAWNVCFNQGMGYAMLGRTADAIQALRCAVASGRVTAPDLRDEHNFDRIRADTAFAAIVASVAAAAPSSGGQPQSK